MIYSHEHKVVIYTPFKNYSSTIQAYFSNNRGKFYPIAGENPDYNYRQITRISRHSISIPDNVRDSFKKILPVRNPYERVISQYWWHYNHHEKIDFEKWLYTHSKQPACMPVTVIYRDHDCVIRVENLEEELEKHNLIVYHPSTNERIPIPHRNKTENKVEMDLAEEHAELIYFLHYEDFAAGGYERLYK
jgi:hypothetical protein